MSKVQDSDEGAQRAAKAATEARTVAVDKASPASPQTAGDVAEAATTDQGAQLTAAVIPFPTPVTEQQDPGTNIGMASLQYLQPPEDPQQCWNIYQLSPYLEPHIAALDANVYSSGYDLVLDSALDCEEDILLTRIEESLQFILASGPDSVPDVPRQYVQQFHDKLKRRIKWEKKYLERFFAACSPDMPYEELETFTGQDVEVCGNAYHEVLRDKQGRVARFIWSPAKFVRAVPLQIDEQRVPLTRPVRDPILGFADEPQYVKFRRWALLARDTNTVQCYYKSFGDPRTVSRRTGDIYASLEELRQREPTSLPATELFHYAMPYAGSTAYGKPVWSGSTAALEASRDLDEENLKFINDEVLPSLLMMVAGPRIGEPEIKRFQDQVEDRAKRKGRGMLLLNAHGGNASPGVPTQQATIHVEKLKSEQINEAIFSGLDKRVEEKVHMAFRLPGIAMGVTGQGVNRATAMVMRRFAEDQVYTPRRDWYSRCKNVLLDAMRIQCWRYRCNAVPPRDPESLANIIKTLMEAGVLTPDEGRNLSQVIFNERFADLPGVWSTLPTKLLVAVLQTKNPTLAAALMHEGELSMEKLGEVLQTGMLQAAGQVQGANDDEREPPEDTDTADADDGDADGK